MGSFSSSAGGPVASVAVVAASNILCYLANENSLMYQACPRLPPLLFASNWRAATRGIPHGTSPPSAAPRPATFWALDILSPHHLVDPILLPLGGQLALHLLLVAWLPLSVGVEIGIDFYVLYGTRSGDRPPDWEWLTYFTHWTLLLVAVAGIVAAANTARHMKRTHQHHLTTAVPEVVTGESQRWDALSVAHLLLMETAVTAGLFISVYFWIGIVLVTSGSVSPGISNYLQHGGNCVVLLLEVLLTRLPFLSYHFQVMLWYGSVYSIFLWIYGEASGTWRYDLDWHRPASIGAYALIPVMAVIIFVIWFWVARWRERVVVQSKSRKLAKTQDRAAVELQPAGED